MSISLYAKTLTQSAIQHNGLDAIVFDQSGIVQGAKIVPKRQTVMSGPTDANGAPSFGGVIGAQFVTMTGTLIVTAANGYGVGGPVDRIGSITNASWATLTTNGTMYLYVDINADGSCVTGSTTLMPVEQWAGTQPNTLNQFTFNVQDMIGKVGNGVAAIQTYRVFVGEVTVAAANVTAIVWYALNGTYRSTLGNLTAINTTQRYNNNLGVDPKFQRAQIFITNHTAAYNGYAQWSVYESGCGYTAGSYVVGHMKVETNETRLVTACAQMNWTTYNRPQAGTYNNPANGDHQQYLVVQRTY